MKEFFLNLLNNLDKLAGLRQVEKIYASHTDQNEAKKEINTLLDLLVNICTQFPYIPEEEKKRIIQHSVVTDPEFNSLNARIVYKWLALQKDKYYKEMAHIPSELKPEDQPVPKDSPKYEEHLQNWLKALQPLEERINKTSKKEVMIPAGQRQGPIDYSPLSDEEVIKRNNHIQYLRENYHPVTRERLPNWMSEEEWNKVNTPGSLVSINPKK